MQISAGLRINGLGLVDEKEKVVIISDLHVGYEEHLTRQGVLVPRTQYKDMSESIAKLIDEERPETFVIAGDMKHEFGEVSNQEWRDALKIIDLILEKTKRLFIIKGNHDTIIRPIANKRNVEVVQSFVFGNTMVLHGDVAVKIPENIKTIIIGHIHPAVRMAESGRSEKFKCFLSGKYKGKGLIVMPAFNPLTTGTDVLGDKEFGPFLKDLNKFDVYISTDKVYHFGKVKELKRFGASL